MSKYPRKFKGPIAFANKQVDLNHMQGRHSENFDAETTRLEKAQIWRDLSTVWVTPTVEHRLDDQVVFQSWMGISKAPNQKFIQMCIGNAEVGDAYNTAVEMILKDTQHPWKYMLTVESDNLPPRDGMMKLYESVDQFDVIAGLYWMKSETGHAHIYGDPADPNSNFEPRVPKKDTVQPCNGTAMGFTLFSMDLFRKTPGPWFVTRPGLGTQDLYFFEKLRKEGIPYKAAVDTRCKVGHIDFTTRTIW